MAVGIVLVAPRARRAKANASLLLGALYDKRDSRCDSGFTVFYLGLFLRFSVDRLTDSLVEGRAASLFDVPPFEILRFANGEAVERRGFQHVASGF